MVTKSNIDTLKYILDIVDVFNHNSLSNINYYEHVKSRLINVLIQCYSITK